MGVAIASMCVYVCSSVSHPAKGPASVVCMPDTLTKRMTPSRKAFPPDYRCILSEVCARLSFYFSLALFCRLLVMCWDAARPCFYQMPKFTVKQTLFKSISSFHWGLLKSKATFTLSESAMCSLGAEGYLAGVASLLLATQSLPLRSIYCWSTGLKS